MTIEFYIGHQPDGTPHTFEHFHESYPTLDVAKRLHKFFADKSEYYALFANVNVQERQLDYVLLSQRGMGIIETKHWTAIPTTSGEPIDNSWEPVETVKAASRIERAFQQVIKQRNALADDFRTFHQNPANKINLGWKSKKFDIQGCVTPTAGRFDTKHITPLYKESTWFQLIWLEELHEWATALNFGDGLSIREHHHVEKIATKFFKAIRWHEMESVVKVREPYGYLRDGDRNLPLINPEIMIGRDVRTDITVPASKTLVSRQHARITRRLTNTYIEDIGSSNGTFVNGNRLIGECKLLDGSSLVFGTINPDGTPISESAHYVYLRELSNASETKINGGN